MADILFTVITYHSEPLFFILNTNRTRSVILVFGMKRLLLSCMYLYEYRHAGHKEYSAHSACITTRAKQALYRLFIQMNIGDKISDL